MTNLLQIDPASVSEFAGSWVHNLCCIFATVVGAIAGATAFCRVRMDAFGVIACGAIASLGGGTVRDMLLSGQTYADGSPVPIFWTTEADENLLYYAILTSLAVFFITRFHKLPTGTIRVADAFSMAFFTILGCSKAILLGCPSAVVVCMGMCTGVAGGVLRDVLTDNVPYIFRPGELYATASFSGCIAFILLLQLGLSYAPAFILAATICFIIRMCSVYLSWKLPSYRPLFEPAGHADDLEHQDHGQQP